MILEITLAGVGLLIAISGRFVGHPISGLVIGGVLVLFGTVAAAAPAVLVQAPPHNPMPINIQYGHLSKPNINMRIPKSTIFVYVGDNGCDNPPTIDIVARPMPTYVELGRQRVQASKELSVPELTSDRRLGECYVTAPAVFVTGVNHWIVHSRIDGVENPEKPEPSNIRIGSKFVEHDCRRAEPKWPPEPFPSEWTECAKVTIADDVGSNRREAMVLIASTAGIAIGIGLMISGLTAFAVQPTARV